MTTDPNQNPWAPPARSDARSEAELASFPHASVVQLLSVDAHRPDAVVIDLHPALVTVTETRISATDGDVAWSWLVADIEAVVHGANATWTIIIVPGLADFGVSVPDDNVSDFRGVIGTLPGLEVRYQHGSAPAPQPRPVPSAQLPVDEPLMQSDIAASDDIAAEADVPLVIVEATPITASITTRVPVVDSALADELVEAAPAPVLFDPLVVRDPAPLVPAQSDAVAARRGGVGAKAGLLRLRDRASRPASATSAQPASLAGLDARNISAWFGTHQVLDRVSLKMVAGEVTALIGPSGCGKSTFLRILNRMHEMIPAAAMGGEVLLDGHDIYDPSRKLIDARREIGMVFQKPNPFPAMSIYDNVLASFRLTGVKASDDVKDETVESCLSKAGLWKEVRDRLRSPGGGLSGGQQQRLCIARALAIRPRVLLMDEPCSALDPTSTRRIEETITQLASEVTIVIVTHNMQQAARVSHQCAFFLAEQGTPGYIVEHGPTAAMFGSPQDQRTNDYVNGRFG